MRMICDKGHSRCEVCGKWIDLIGVCRECLAANQDDGDLFSRVEKFIDKFVPPAVSAGPNRKCYIDMSELVSIDDFDEMLRAIDEVLESSKSLILSRDYDRNELGRRLQAALGAVITDDMPDPE